MNIKTHITTEGQNIFDVALQVYGDVSGVWKLCVENKLGLADDLIPGQKLVYDYDAPIEKSIRDYYISNSYRVNTGLQEYVALAGIHNEYHDEYHN